MIKRTAHIFICLLGLSLIACSDGDVDTPGSNPLIDPLFDPDAGGPDARALPNIFDAGSRQDAFELTDAGSGLPVQDADPQEPVDMEPMNPEQLPEDPGHNAGWIGGPCSADDDCTYEEAFCLTEEDGYPRGSCSLDCERFCPDRDGMPVTFCIEGVVAGNGGCVQRCDYNIFPNGCRPGYHCETRPRYGEPGVGRGVCVPGVETFDPASGACFDELDQRGLNYDHSAPISDVPDDAPHLRCVIDDPIRLHSPVGGVTWQYMDREPSSMLMGCDLAVAVHRFSQLLAEYDIEAVGHIGTYNCRTIRGNDAASHRISQHGLGRAIDLRWFRQSDGTIYDVYDHWEHGVVDDFRTPEAAFLYAIAQEMHQRRIFNIVLTPEFNAAHDNHFHVDLTEGSHFIGTLNDRGHRGSCSHSAP